MKERILKSGRRKKASKGQRIAIGDDVWTYLNRMRKPKESWDAFMRRNFGIETREGEPQRIVEGWLEVNTGRLYLAEDEARGAAVQAMAAKGTKHFIKPIKMREVV